MFNTACAQSHIRSGVWVIAVVLTMVPSALAATVPFDKAVAVIESKEKNLQVMRWKAVSQEAALSNPTDSKSVVKIKPDVWKTQITFDPIAKRYRMEEVNVTEWLKGAAPNIAIVTGYSFDGEIYRGWERHKAGAELPTTADPSHGDITRDRRDMFFDQRDRTATCGYTSGISCMPPFFSDAQHSPQPLSRLLRTWSDEKKEVTVVAGSDETWTISTTVKNAGQDYSLRVHYDPIKGAILGAQWVLALRDGSEIEQDRLEIDLQEVNNVVWAPKEIRRVLPLDNRMIFTTFDSVEANPPIDENTFCMPFPDGASVTDHIKKMCFVAGKPIDESAATHTYMNMYSLRNPPPSSWITSHRGLLVTCSCILLLLSVVTLVAKRMRRVVA